MIMERKLELKDIAGYLPYDLSAINYIDEIYEVQGFNNWHDMLLFQNGNDEELINETEYHITNIKPILRPLSDLYKTITHNGKGIIPIVELAKMAYINLGWKLNDDVNILDCAIRYFEDGIGYMYMYFDHMGWFVGSQKLYGKEERYEMDVPNQYQLFDYLNELKIDYRGLIDSCLAISAHDLKENPYK